MAPGTPSSPAVRILGSRLAALFLGFAGIAANSCDESAPEHPSPPEPPGAVAPPPARPLHRSQLVQEHAGGAPSKLEKLEEGEALLAAWRVANLELAARGAPGGKLALGRSWVARLTATELQVFDTKTFRAQVSVPISGSSQVITASDGGLIAIDGEHLFRLEPRASNFQHYARPTFFPDSQLIPDPLDYEALYVFHRPSPTLYKYGLEKADPLHLPILQTIPLDSPNANPSTDPNTAPSHSSTFSTLRDGAFVVGTENRIVLSTAGGSSRAYSLRSREHRILRLVAGTAIRQAWVLWDDAELQLVQFGQTRTTVLEDIHTEGAPLDLEADKKQLLTLELTAPGTSPRRFDVVGRELSGKIRFRVDAGLLLDGAGADWVGRALRDKQLALSRFEPLFALGGENALRVFSTQTGALVFDATSLSN